jgi:frataxin
MDESRFHKIADATLARLAEALEAADPLDVELQGGILTIALADGRQYVLNKHAPNRQLWLASPISGASHYAADAEGRWIGTRGQGDLAALLGRELAPLAGVDLALG